MEDLVFGSILRETLLGEERTPIELASKLEVAPATAAKWLRGETIPASLSLAKILLVVSRNHYELLHSATYRRYQQLPEYIQNAKPYNFQEIAGNLVTDAVTSSRLAKDEISKLFAIFDAVDKYDADMVRRASADTSPESEIFILPSPAIAIVRDWCDLIESIRKDPSELYNLSWKSFEDLVGHLLEERGWRITPMGYTKDEGIDLIAARTVPPQVEFTMMVQCKKYRHDRKVGMSVVKDVWATKWENGFHHAMIATTSYFTKGVMEKAVKWNFDLRDHNAIINLCKDYGSIVV